MSKIDFMSHCGHWPCDKMLPVSSTSKTYDFMLFWKELSARRDLFGGNIVPLELNLDPDSCNWHANKFLQKFLDRVHLMEKLCSCLFTALCCTQYGKSFQLAQQNMLRTVCTSKNTGLGELGVIIYWGSSLLVCGFHQSRLEHVKSKKCLFFSSCDLIHLDSMTPSPTSKWKGPLFYGQDQRDHVRTWVWAMLAISLGWRG